jgi:hypothetical protein
LTNFNLETFQLIQNGISTQNLTIENLYSSNLKSTPTPTVIYFNKQLKEAADKREQTKGTSIFNLTSWTNPTNKQPNSDCKMFIILYYLVLISISSSPIITQNSIECMYSVLNKYGSPSQFKSTSKEDSNKILNCISSLFQTTPPQSI